MGSTLIDTKYGYISILEEEGVKKVNFDKSKFNSMMDFLGFIKDETLTKNLLNH